jgi:hypothetical protein
MNFWSLLLFLGLFCKIGGPICDFKITPRASVCNIGWWVRIWKHPRDHMQNHPAEGVSTCLECWIYDVWWGLRANRYAILLIGLETNDPDFIMAIPHHAHLISHQWLRSEHHGDATGFNLSPPWPDQWLTPHQPPRQSNTAVPAHPRWRHGRFHINPALQPRIPIPTVIHIKEEEEKRLGRRSPTFIRSRPPTTVIRGAAAVVARRWSNPLATSASAFTRMDLHAPRQKANTYWPYSGCGSTSWPRYGCGGMGWRLLYFHDISSWVLQLEFAWTREGQLWPGLYRGQLNRIPTIMQAQSFPDDHGSVAPRRSLLGRG